MTATTIQRIHARQILDSRGRPTVEAEIALAGGIVARASVPSGASTGKAEAVELRDGGNAWEGRGVTRAVENVRRHIAELLQGQDVLDQSRLDERMRAADGTPNLARLGSKCDARRKPRVRSGCRDRPGPASLSSLRRSVR